MDQIADDVEFIRFTDGTYTFEELYNLPPTNTAPIAADTRPNQVWCSDISYIPVKRGFLYLVAIIDWATRKVLSWRLSNTMDARFCKAVLDEAIAKYGPPQIMNTDQGSQFTGRRGSPHWLKRM